MNLEDFQSQFQKAWLSIDKKKSIFVFFSLCLCGLVIVFSRVISLTSGPWVKLSLSFAPIFLIGGLLFALGIIITQAYTYAQKGKKVSYLQIAFGSWKTLVAVTYITLPMLLLCLLSWLVLGVFFLLKEIPAVGDMVSVFLSFAPFVLILLSLFLIFFNVMLLFFLTPPLSEKKELDLSIWKETFQKILYNPLVSLLSLFVACLPLAFVLTFLVLAAVLTQKSYLPSVDPLLIGMKWFFLMLPFNALLTPVIIFFFNFAAEFHSYSNENLKVLVKSSS